MSQQASPFGPLTPTLVPNSIYSLSSLHASLNAQPKSAPPYNNFRSNFGDSTGTGPHQKDQLFFGRDFNASSFLQSSSSMLYGNGSGGSSAGFFGGESSGDFGGGKRANSAESLTNNLADNFNSLLNFRPPMHVPMSAPPVPRQGHGLGALGGGLHNNFSMRRSGRPPKPNQPELFALKVFLGGLAPNLTTNILQLNFSKFGANTIDWPKKTPVQDRPPNGYAFVVFEKETSVLQMLGACHQSNNRVFYPVYTLNGLMHPVEIKVWEMKDTIYENLIGWRKFRRFSVFVGGIPRTCTAAVLTFAIQEIIGPVAYCAIELDQDHFYPKGAACVVFSNKESYIKAIAAQNVMLSFGTFERKAEFKPFLASNMPCEKCGTNSGTRYCQEMICLAYYCQSCWKQVHNVRPSMSAHVPCKRHVKAEQRIGARGVGGAGDGGVEGGSN